MPRVNRDNVGRVRRKLAGMLSRALTAHYGHEVLVDPAAMATQEGGYRSVHWDLARWFVDIHVRMPMNEGGPVVNRHIGIHSWATMTELVKQAELELLENGHNEFEVL